jgi:hypothetical protein
MRKFLLGAGLLAVAGLAYPSAGVAEFSYGIVPVSNNKQLLQFSDGTKCGLNVSVSKAGSTAKSNGRYYCWNTKAPLKPLKIRMKNFAGGWLSGRQGAMNFTTCKTHACSAKEATYSGLPSGQMATSTVIFDVYYPRSHGFGLPPMSCEYVKDPEGKGPPGHRITCALQARTS